MNLQNLQVRELTIQKEKEIEGGFDWKCAVLLATIKHPGCAKKAIGTVVKGMQDFFW